jgi:hypothetical protein
MNRGKIQVLKATSKIDTSPGRIRLADRLFKDTELIIEVNYSRNYIRSGLSNASIARRFLVDLIGL